VEKVKKVTQIELIRMFRHGEYEALAKHPQLFKAQAEVIKALAAAQNCRVRESLALNPAIAKFPDIIVALATDIDPRVRCCVASNPALNTHN